jgi:hypothetical protein
VANESLPTADDLRRLFRYDALTGDLYWRERPKQSRANITRPINGMDRRGYPKAKVNGRCITVHRIVWCMVHGDWPEGEIDHINGNRADNRIENLRLVTRRQNALNIGLNAQNTSGYKGVHWCPSPKGRHWRAMIRSGGKRHHLGHFATAEEAYAAYCDAAKRLHGEFATGNHRGEI